ncbi:nickel pincer cofactor biosynthesis protein LarB [Alkalicoccus chagannorensis]|uniref:nickel pincer cofactor biosynthesis protein LarB n=1 Tax=Alkalicoccus chagannorensis TaxID=427072 RepID=UPI00040623B0|nr:nickel pincer cofactor biosynthesis protein LarB [Alkalicoccus chagannorensis]
MDMQDILRRVQEGSLDPAEAEVQLKGYEEKGYAKIDHARRGRQGFPEVIFGENKTTEQLKGIVDSLVAHEENVLITRLDDDKAAELTAARPFLTYDPVSRLAAYQQRPFAQKEGYVAVVCAGTSDLPVAEEAAQTLDAFGVPVRRIYDVGVAGLHRLLDHVEEIRGADVTVTVAGMEGALTSVVGGLVDHPVIAVPTSVGYGAHFNGLAPLLSMLNSCASGVSVVNIDNGFGGAYSAAVIYRAIREEHHAK